VGSRAAAERLLDARAVLVDGEARGKSHKLAGGEELEIQPLATSAAEPTVPPPELTVAYADEHLLVVDKPAGLVVHPAAGNFDGTLVNALLHHCKGSLSGIGGVARPGIVHRIDKDTSGLLLIAKTDVTHAALAKQFADHSIERRYLAIVNGLPRTTEGTIDANLARSSVNRKKIAIVEAGRGKRAVTHWKRLTALRDAALVECRLETGRTHQVRVHMASIAHPLLGDPVYGGNAKAHRALLRELGFERQALHAARIGFIHPVSKARLSFDSALPSDMQELFSALVV
jgi:23S rRNA pseudouridine1911/1915/1917 synthase